MEYSNLSNIQGHPVNTAVAPFKSIATVTNTILPNPHDCYILVPDEMYSKLVFGYRRFSSDPSFMPNVIANGLTKQLITTIQRKEMYYWSPQYSHYYPVDTFLSFDINRLLFTFAINNIKYTVGFDAICPYSVFSIPEVIYKLISFDELGNKIQSGDIVRYVVEPIYRKYFGLRKEQINTIVTVFDRNGNGYLVNGRLGPTGILLPPF